MLVFNMDMEIKKTESFNTYFSTPNQAFKNFQPSYYSLNNDSFKKNPPKEEQNLKVKLGVISAAILSTAGVIYGITKKRGQNPFKNWNLFKQEINPMDMLKITGVSVPVSLGVGIALDKKENRTAKVKEGISQMVGNLLVPIFW